MISPLRIFIGYDSREPLAYHVLAHSILRRASRPVAITPLVQPMLRACGLYTRLTGPTESTEFSLTRFLVPYLSGYQGVSLFLDCDMLAQCDLPIELEDYIRRLEASGSEVSCCQHTYTPRASPKFLGQVQTVYPRKNWSSFMIFQNDRCRALTPDAVNHQSGLWLHRFEWAAQEIGALPLDFNWLVGEYAPRIESRVLHYTLGGPWFDESVSCDHADVWHREHRALVGGLGASARPDPKDWR